MTFLNVLNAGRGILNQELIGSGLVASVTTPQVIGMNLSQAE